MIMWGVELGSDDTILFSFGLLPTIGNPILGSMPEKNHPVDYFYLLFLI